MRAIMIMFDSLNRRYLPNYGCDWTHAPNFKRLGERCVTFDNAYVGSMPCMPARRELHTGRYNFLHRSWGPLEPYDDSMPEMLKLNGVYTHLTSDHYHYWEDGASTYHQRYSSWEFNRGQEGDVWKAHVPDTQEQIRAHAGRPSKHQDPVNRCYMREEHEYPQAQTFQQGTEFLHTNHDKDNWFLQIETFDPHEPFHSHPSYHQLYPHDYDGEEFDWPPYSEVRQGAEVVEHVKMRYAALLSMCDTYLGRVLDVMDRYDMWEDTLLIVNTDHGYLIGEHGWWAKCVMPFWNEVAHMPMFIWDPRSGKRDERRESLVQMIDLPATLLEYFGLEVPPDMQGKPLRDVIAEDQPVREAALFGTHGAHVSVTDGRYVYMRGPTSPDNQPLSEYVIMATKHGRGRAFIDTEVLQEATLAEPFSFTKNCPTLKIPAHGKYHNPNFATLLYDLESDPGQEHPLTDEVVEARMVALLKELMAANDAPPEQYTRLGLD